MRAAPAQGIEPTIMQTWLRDIALLEIDLTRSIEAAKDEGGLSQELPEPCPGKPVTIVGQIEMALKELRRQLPFLLKVQRASPYFDRDHDPLPGRLLSAIVVDARP